MPTSWQSSVVVEGASGILQSLAELEEEAPVTSTDTADEVRENTWSLSRADDDWSSSAASVDAALRSLVDTWRIKLHEQDEHGRATFYAWYDAQSGMLNISLSSRGASALPFQAGGKHTPDNLRELTPDWRAEVDPHRQRPGITTTRATL